MLLTIIAALPIAIWTYLLFGRGGFWRVKTQLKPLGLHKVNGKRVAIVIPARNEAEVICETVTSLLEQTIAPAPRIFVVDDGSTDGTAAACEWSDRLTVMQGKPLAPGWTGKLWALSQGADAALATNPDYLLFTDADIRHHSESVSELIAIAETHAYDLVSYMVRLRSKSTAERALIPAFVFFFFMLYPPAFIRWSRSKIAGAAGGCVLIRPAMLRKIGGLAAIRGEIIDDCALARAVKQNGGRVWLGLTSDVASTRSYGSFAAIGNMIARTAFNQLHHSELLLAGTIVGLFVTYLLPICLLFSGRLLPALLGATAWLMMSFAYCPMMRFYRQHLLWSFSLPAVALFYSGATILSAVRYWRGSGGDWKGRAQDIRENA